MLGRGLLTPLFLASYHPDLPFFASGSFRVGCDRGVRHVGQTKKKESLLYLAGAAGRPYSRVTCSLSRQAPNAGSFFNGAPLWSFYCQHPVPPPSLTLHCLLLWEMFSLANPFHLVLFAWSGTHHSTALFVLGSLRCGKWLVVLGKP